MTVITLKKNPGGGDLQTWVGIFWVGVFWGGEGV